MPRPCNAAGRSLADDRTFPMEGFAKQVWPQPVVPTYSGFALSRQVEDSIQLACRRLAAFPQPLTLATEHLLLGLAAADHEVGGVAPRAWAGAGHFGSRNLPALWILFSSPRGATRGLSRADSGAGSPQTDELQQEDRPRRSVALQDENRPRQSVALQDAAFPIALLRILDAAANRAREGLRVIEDYIRFALDDRHLTDCCKQARHALADTLAGVPPLQRLAARETQADVGTALTLPRRAASRQYGRGAGGQFQPGPGGPA